jgi:CoA:oxalate CoA-transferase
MSHRPLPLAGVTVVDFTQIYNGPYATFLMATAGARVIKVEPPGGEHLRKRGAAGGAALPFAMLNGGKLSVTANLKSDDGLALATELALKADVLVENFAPGVLERLGLGYPALSARNPGLVYASGSGYGSDGPYRDYPAMDLTVQAISGVMSTTGESGGPPMKAGPAVCDFFGGIHLYGAVVTALFDRQRTGQGRQVEVSMMEAIYTSMTSNLGLYFGSGGTGPSRTGNRHGGLSLCPYNVYPSADGYIAIICNHESHWQGLLRAMKRDDMLSESTLDSMAKRVARIDEVDRFVSEWSRTLGKQEAFERLLAQRVPSAPVRDLEEVVADPHLRARGMLHDIVHPEYGAITVPDSPMRYGGSAPAPISPSPRLGSHNSEVYGTLLGRTPEALRRLHEQGSI